jgi:hypothetical protein
MIPGLFGQIPCSEKQGIFLTEQGTIFAEQRISNTPMIPANVRFRGVVSTGRCNTCIRSLCWGFNSEGFTWLFVELTHHFV